MRKLLVALMLLFATSAYSQIVTELLTTATETVPPGSPLYYTGFPISTWYHDQRLESIYLASELSAAGLTAGATITSVHLKVCETPGMQVTDFRVRMQHTTLSATPAAWTSTGWTDCYGPTTIPQAAFTLNAWYEFVFTTPFQWDGTSNVIIDFSTDGVNYVSGGGCFVRNTATTRSRRTYTDSVYAWPFEANPTQITHNLVPSLQMTYTPGGPGLDVVATPGAAQVVHAPEQGPGGNGLHVGSFVIESNTMSGAELTGIEIQASGTGNDANAFLDVAIFRDFDNNDIFDFGTDIQIGAAGNFLADDGTIMFNVQTGEQLFGVQESRTYFVVVRLAGTASAGQTFDFTVSDLTISAATAYRNGTPTVAMNGIIIAQPEFEFTDASPAAAQTVFLGTSGNVCQVLDIEYLGGPDDKPGNITVNGLGTAHEVDDLLNVQLWYDADQSQDFDAGLDTLVDTGTFSADNGTVSFTFSSHPTFQAQDTRRFFIVYNLTLTAGDNETFQCYVSAMAPSAFGATAVNLPAPGTNGTAGLVVSANVLLATLNGPAAATSVNSNTTGPHGDGALLADVTVSAAPGASWTATVLTFEASGSGNSDTAFSEVALYQDSGSNTWDGAAVDTLAAPVAGGFSTGEVSFNLNDTSFPQGQARRFYLVGKMNGSALAGETFNARLQDITATPPAGGAINGVPTADSAALIIGTAAVTIGNAANQPGVVWHPQGSAQHYVVALFDVIALNGATTVNGFTLTAGGTGNWPSGVSAASGIEAWLDDGDGMFDDATDSLVFQGGGGATVNVAFTSPLNLAVSGTAQIWIRIGLTDMAGLGAASAAETYSVAIADAADINATTPAVLGAPPPASISLGAIEFNVSSFSPTSDLPAGGRAITIMGSGFVAPLTVTIGGIVCPGSPQIAGGTSITGLTVPTGGGTGLPIVITSGELPPQTIGQTFRYSAVGNASGSSGGDGCAVSGGASWLGWLLLAPLLMLGARRRRA